MLEPLPQELGFQFERITDRHEGEEPARVIAEKPILGLPRPALDIRYRRLKLFLKTQKGIFEHCIHQCRLWAHASESDPRVEELFRQHTDIGRPLIPGVPLARLGLR